MYDYYYLYNRKINIFKIFFYNYFYLPSPGLVLTTGKGGVGAVRLRPCLALPFLRLRKLKGLQFFLLNQVTVKISEKTLKIKKFTLIFYYWETWLCGSLF